MKEPVDFRGRVMSNTLPSKEIRLAGVAFHGVISAGKKEILAYVTCREGGTSVTFYRPYFGNPNEETFSVSFPALKSTKLPPLIVDADEVSLEKDVILADAFVAQNATVEIFYNVSNPQKFIFYLTLLSKQYRVTLSLKKKVTLTRQLQHFMYLS